jgi:hypothetical protein
MSRYTDLRTIRQLAQENPAFTEASLRWLVFNAQQNGLDAAIVRVGRRVLIDVRKLDAWLEAQHGARS